LVNTRPHLWEQYDRNQHHLQLSLQKM